MALFAVVLASFLAAGRGYFFCIPMQQAMASCCCAATPADPGEVAPSEPRGIRANCCDERVLGSVPPTQIASSDPFPIPAAASWALPVPAAAPEPLATTAPVLPSSQRPATPIRAGPSGGSQICTTLRVLRC